MTETNPILPPLTERSNLIGWAKKNLFATWYDALLTILGVLFVYWFSKVMLTWAFTTARWEVISANFRLIMIGQYPIDHINKLWIWLAFVVLLSGTSVGLIVCTITGLVILTHGFWQFSTSAYLTVSAFESAAGKPGEMVALACLIVFAFTTMISWAHFSERCYQYLGGHRTGGYRGVFAAIAFAGPLLPVGAVWAVGDIVIGLLLLLHLLPMIYVVLTQIRPMMRDLGGELGKQPVHQV